VSVGITSSEPFGSFNEDIATSETPFYETFLSVQPQALSLLVNVCNINLEPATPTSVYYISVKVPGL